MLFRSDAQYIRNVGMDMGVQLKIRMRTDSSAALANASKLGPGRIRHLEQQAAYLKECVRKKYVMTEKIAGKTNLSDILTKHYKPEVITSFRPWLGLMKAKDMGFEPKVLDMKQVSSWSSIKQFVRRPPMTEDELKKIYNVPEADATETIAAIEDDGASLLVHDGNDDEGSWCVRGLGRSTAHSISTASSPLATGETPTPAELASPESGESSSS